MHLRIPLKRTRESQSVYLWSDQNGAKTIPFWAAHTYQANIREYHPWVKTYISLLLLWNWQLNMQSAKTKTLFKFGTKTHRTDSPILCCFTYSGSCYRIHRKRSMQGPFQKRNLLSLLKVPDEQILEVEEKKTKQWVIIFRSFSILPSHLAVGTSKTGYHYFSRRLQRYPICNILQGVYEVLVCRLIQTNQIGTMYEPSSCSIRSFANEE